MFNHNFGKIIGKKNVRMVRKCQASTKKCEDIYKKKKMFYKYEKYEEDMKNIVYEM